MAHLRLVQWIEQGKFAGFWGIFLKGRTKQDQDWLLALGNNLEKVIAKRGYKSPYDFWTESAGDIISRTTLHYVLTGQVDLKVTTLKKLAEALDVDVAPESWST